MRVTVATLWDDWGNSINATCQPLSPVLDKLYMFPRSTSHSIWWNRRARWIEVKKGRTSDKNPLIIPNIRHWGWSFRFPSSFTTSHGTSGRKGKLAWDEINLAWPWLAGAGQAHSTFLFPPQGTAFSRTLCTEWTPAELTTAGQVEIDWRCHVVPIADHGSS